MNQIIWRSPSNIALIKYWGKTGEQIPMNPSISFTLQESYTETKVIYAAGNEINKVSISFLFEGESNVTFETRLYKFINRVSEFLPNLNGLHLQIESRNSFPHSSGIASSASAMSALALALVTIEQKLTGKTTRVDDFLQMASFIARLGSGSAARSVYGGYTFWGETPDNKLFSNEFAVPINDLIHPVFKSYHDAVLIVSEKKKEVSSTVGHQLMENHPFANSKFKQSFKNAGLMLELLKKGEQLDFALLTEAEALSLHAMMMTSNPSYILMEPNTLSLIQKIRAYRQDMGLPVCFSLDAGANVHFIYPHKNELEVKEFINQELVQLCSQNRWMDDRVGNGPMEL